MGNKQSSAQGDDGTPDGPLSDKQMEEFRNNTTFSPQDIQQLLLVYRKICGETSGGGDGLIDKEEFKKEIKFANDDIAKKMYDMIDVNGDQKIEFSEFVYGLNTFSPNSNLDDKIEKCFKAYDDDGGGTISKNEVRDIINMSLKDNHLIELDDAHLQQLLDDLFEIYDTSKDPGGSMSKTDFGNMVKKAPGILDAFSFDMSMLPSLAELKGS